MTKKVVTVLVLLCFLGVASPLAMAQNRDDRHGGFLRRGKNGYRVGDGRITFLDGPGFVNYEHRHRWMPGFAGGATVIGIGAGGGAAVGGLTRGKKGAVIGALVGGGGATALWLYKNRRHKHRYFDRLEDSRVLINFSSCCR